MNKILIRDRKYVMLQAFEGIGRSVPIIQMLLDDLHGDKSGINIHTANAQSYTT